MGQLEFQSQICNRFAHIFHVHGNKSYIIVNCITNLMRVQKGMQTFESHKQHTK
jgi:hypothetical protein